MLQSTAGFVAVSCPSAAGCWALGVTNGNTYPVLARINSTGRVIRTIVVRTAATLTAISCVGIRACEVAGSGPLPPSPS